VRTDFTTGLRFYECHLERVCNTGSRYATYYNIRRDYSPSAEVSKDVIAADSLPRNLFSTENFSKSKAIKRKKGTLLEDLGGKRRSARVRIYNLFFIYITQQNGTADGL
jgi:hypothetical protein